MSRTFVYSTIILMLCLIFSFGCSGATSIPTSPTENPIVATPQKEAQSERMLWGIWQFSYDQISGEVVPVPMREADLHYRVDNLLLPPNCSDCVNIQINSVDLINHLLDVDVTLRNPTSRTVYDARLIVYTDNLGHELLNPDDWTGLWDIPGGLAINPFRAYGKLNANREFLPAVQLTENFLVSIPDPPQLELIVFAVDASWPANCEDPYEISNFWQETIYDVTGQYGAIYVDVHDWQNDVSSVVVNAPAITGVSSTPLALLSGDIWYTYLINDAGAAAGNYEVEIVASSGGIDLYDFATVTISSEPNTITLTQPNGGEAWGVGSSQSITWDWTGNIPNINLYYYKDNDEGTLTLIEQGVTNTGSYNWASIPDDPSTTVKVRVYDNANLANFDDSDDFFTIEPATLNPISVTGPNGGEVWEVGSSQMITWAWTGDIPYVNISYFKDNDEGTAVVISMLVENTGSYNWVSIPDDPSTTVKVRVYDTADLSSFDDSNDFFTIEPGTPRTITVTEPGYLDVWEVWSAHLITWDWTGNIPYVKISYYKDNDFGTEVIIEEYVTNTGSYNWSSIPNDPSENVRIRISDQFEPTVYGDSDLFFTIVEVTGGWVKTWGGTGDDKANAVTIDGSGNKYVTGEFSGTVDFGPGIDPHTSNGLNDIYLVKYDGVGVFQWACTWGGVNYEQGVDVATDSSNNVYVTGWFQSTVDFDPGPGTDYHASAGASDAYLSKFDSSGNLLWARTWGGSSYDHGQGVVFGTSGALDCVWVTGYYSSVADFDPGAGTDSRLSYGAEDAFLSNFNTFGTYQYALTWGGTYGDEGKNVTLGTFDDVIVTGEFDGTVDFDPSIIGENWATSNGLSDAFLSVFDSGGNFQWVSTWGGSGGSDSIAPSEAAADLSSGSIYVVGHFNGVADFDPSAGVEEHTSNGETDVFLSKLDSGGALEWVRTWGGAGSEYGWGLAVDGSGDIYTTGYWFGTVDFDPGPVLYERNSGFGPNSFLSKFYPSGDFHSVRLWGGSQADWGNSVAVEGAGDAYVTGFFQGTADFDPGPGVNNRTSNGEGDSYLVQIPTL